MKIKEIVKEILIKRKSEIIVGVIASILATMLANFWNEIKYNAPAIGETIWDCVLNYIYNSAAGYTDNLVSNCFLGVCLGLIAAAMIYAIKSSADYSNELKRLANCINNKDNIVNLEENKLTKDENKIIIIEKEIADALNELDVISNEIEIEKNKTVKTDEEIKRIEEKEKIINRKTMATKNKLECAHKMIAEHEEGLKQEINKESIRVKITTLTMIFLNVLFILFIFLSIIIPSSIYNRFNRDLSIIKPYVDDIKEVQILESKWVQMKSKDDYIEIYKAIDEIKEANNLPTK